MFPLSRLSTVGLYKLDEDVDQEKEVVSCSKIEDPRVMIYGDDLPDKIEPIWLGLLQELSDDMPMLKKDTAVVIYKHKDTGIFYWFFVFSALDPGSKHALAKHQFRFSNEDGAEELDDDNSYTFTIDNIDKYISLHTAKNDGEETVWDFMLNTGEGIFTVADDKGNSMSFDSAKEEHDITVKKIDVKAIESYSLTTNLYNISGETGSYNLTNLDYNIVNMNINADNLNIAGTNAYVTSEMFNINAGRTGIGSDVINFGTLATTIYSELLALTGTREICMEGPTLRIKTNNIFIDNGDDDLITLLVEFLQVMLDSEYEGESSSSDSEDDDSEDDSSSETIISTPTKETSDAYKDIRDRLNNFVYESQLIKDKRYATLTN